MNTITNKPLNTVIDLFAGCGGLSLGLYQAGWKGVFAIEKNPCAFETLEYNLIKGKRHFDWPSWLPKEPLDILDINSKYKNELQSLRGKIGLVAGGPPCQGFSMAGKRVANDIRNQLVFSYIEFIENVMPQMLLFENVKGFTFAFDKNQNNKAIPYSKIVIDKLRSLGYDVKAQVIDFSQYGVPQRRKRFILIGVLNGEEGSAAKFIERLDENKSEFLKRRHLSAHCTIEEAISDLLRENGQVETPDRKGFTSGLYGEIHSAYQAYLRKGLSKEQTVPNSHSFAHHGKTKIELFNRLLSEYPQKGKRIDGDERKAWGINQRGITILDAKDIAPTITNMPDDYVHYCEPTNGWPSSWERIPRLFPNGVQILHNLQLKHY